MRLKLIFLFAQFLGFLSCNVQRVEELSCCWLNAGYIECLQNDLPCECEKKTEAYYSLVIDTNSLSENFEASFSRYDLMEPDVFPIKKSGPNRFSLQRSKDDTTAWAELRVQEGRILFVDADHQSLFTRMSTWGAYGADHDRFDNVELLNRALNFRGYPKLEKLLDADFLACYCNKWKGNIDFLYSATEDRSWILTIAEDSLFIDLVTYSSDDPDPDDPIVPKRSKAVKWKNK